MGGRQGPVSWRIAGQSFTTAGISSLSPRFGGVERDGYTNQSLQGRLEIAFSDEVSADFRGYFADAGADFDDFAADAPNRSHTREYLGYAGLNIGLLDGRFRNRFGYARTNTERENFDPRLLRQLTFDASGRNSRFEYEGSFAFSDQVSALFGVEHERSRFSSVSPSGSLAVPIPEPARGKASLTGYYAELSAEALPGLTLSGGLRHDRHSDYGGRTLFSAGAAWDLPTGTILRASYGEGFKAPTLYQLFSEYGNESLSPERARSFEAGIEQQLLDQALRFGASYFDRKSRDEIIYNSCLPGNSDPLCLQPGTTNQRWGYYRNVARTRARGIEGVASLSLGAFFLDGNFSWIAAEDRSAGSNGNWLPRRPRYLANGSVHYALPFGLDLGAALRWSGKAYDNAANSVVLPSYTLVDLRAEQQLTPGLSLFGRVENLFDKEHMTAYRYGSLGRSLFLGVRGRF